MTLISNHASKQHLDNNMKVMNIEHEMKVCARRLNDKNGDELPVTIGQTA